MTIARIAPASTASPIAKETPAATSSTPIMKSANCARKIATGPRGRLQLVRGAESIAFKPNTLASITTRGSNQSRKTDVVQQVGEISLEIEKRQRPHTTVQTPFLAAVVKGTRFSVKVGKTGAAVSVNRGLVQVTSFRSGERSDLGAGQRPLLPRSGASGAQAVGCSGSPPGPSNKRALQAA